MRTKYFNDAIVGNGNVVASFSKKGELLRIFYPNTDYRQFLDFMLTGVKINDSNIIYLSNDINNTYKQYYTEGTNILNTEIFNSYFKLKILQTDFVPSSKNFLIKRYEFKNENSIDLNVNFIIYSKLVSDVNNQVSGFCSNNILKQYMHDYTYATFSKEKMLSYQINSTESNIETGVISGKDYVGMSPDSSVSYDVNILKPGESKILDVFLYIKENSVKNSMEVIDKEIEDILKLDVKRELESTKRYWNKYLKDHTLIDLKEYISIPNVKKIYERTVLLFPLLINSKTGGISAAIEVDEGKTRCGSYAYCWPRDAIYMTEALDNLNMVKEADRFYNTFCKNTQSKNGMWEQRFYTDGTLAPCWGYQIDETASVIYGVYNHYLNTKNETFLKNNLKMCEKAIEFLLKYLEDELGIITICDDVVKNEILEEHPDKHEKLKPSYDLWEECEAIHTYSLAAIYAGFEIMQKIYVTVLPMFESNRLKQEKIRKQNVILEKKLVELKDYIAKNCYDNNLKSFVRNNRDKKMDISLLGLVTPFNVFTPADKKIKNTIEKLNLTIRTYRGGYLRYEGDNYIGGNPWIIANLWMAEYYIKDKNLEEAMKCFEFVIKSCSELGFLGEQVDNKTMKPAWVIGLGWSHAMFINVLKKLCK